MHLFVGFGRAIDICRAVVVEQAAGFAGYGRIDSTTGMARVGPLEYIDKVGALGQKLRNGQLSFGEGSFKGQMFLKGAVKVYSFSVGF